MLCFINHFRLKLLQKQNTVQVTSMLTNRKGTQLRGGSRILNRYAIKACIAHLLGQSGGMPPPEKCWISNLLRLFLVCSWDEIAEVWWPTAKAYFCVWSPQNWRCDFASGRRGCKAAGFLCKSQENNCSHTDRVGPQSGGAGPTCFSPPQPKILYETLLIEYPYPYLQREQCINKTFGLIRSLAWLIIRARRPHTGWILDTGKNLELTRAFLLLWSWSA